MAKNALIVGAGSGLSASLARVYSHAGYRVFLAARNPDKLEDLCRETGARAYACDAKSQAGVKQLFDALDADGATPDVVIYNPSGRTKGPIEQLDPEKVRAALDVTAWGGPFLSPMKRQNAWFRTKQARCCSPVHPPASRGSRNQRRSR